MLCSNHTLSLYGAGDSGRCLSMCFLGLSLLVFYVTCTDISVMYVTAQMYRRTKEEVVVTTLIGCACMDH